MGLATQLNVQCIYSGSRYWRGRRDEEVYLLQHPGILLLDETLHLHGLGVVSAQDELAGQGAVDDIGAVLVPVAGQVGLVGYHPVGKAGGPQRPNVLHAGQAHLHHRYTQFLESGNGIPD